MAYGPWGFLDLGARKGSGPAHPGAWPEKAHSMNSAHDTPAAGCLQTLRRGPRLGRPLPVAEKIQTRRIVILGKIARSAEGLAGGWEAFPLGYLRRRPWPRLFGERGPQPPLANIREDLQ